MSTGARVGAPSTRIRARETRATVALQAKGARLRARAGSPPATRAAPTTGAPAAPSESGRGELRRRASRGGGTREDELDRAQDPPIQCHHRPLHARLVGALPLQYPFPRLLLLQSRSHLSRLLGRSI